MSEATEVPMVCVDCGGTLTAADLFSMTLGEERAHYWHLDQSGCIASLNERLTAATQRAEAAEAKSRDVAYWHEAWKKAEAEREALRKDAALLDALQAEHERFDPVAALVVKVDHDRNGFVWANVVGNVREALTAAVAMQPPFADSRYPAFPRAGETVNPRYLHGATPCSECGELRCKCKAVVP